MPPEIQTSALLSDVRGRLGALVEAARQEGRAQALNEIRALVGGAVSADPVRRGPGRPPGSKSAPTADKADGRRNSWSGLTPEARLERVNALRKGRGLPPKTAL